MKNNGRVLGHSLSGTPSTYAAMREEPPAPRVQQQYFCENGHVFELAFFINAEIPGQWTCPACGELSPTITGGPVDRSGPKRWGSDGKTHLDRLHERRTVHELEALLQEALKNRKLIGLSFPSTF